MSFPGFGSPLYGSVSLPPTAAKNPIVVNRSILWRMVPSTISLAITQRKPLSQTAQRVAIATIFADVNNSIAVPIGNDSLKTSTTFYWDNALLELDPGRNITIETDDWEHEVFDLNKFWALNATNAQTQVLYVTVWQPTFL